MSVLFFEDRTEAAGLLVEALRPLNLQAPVVLGIPRGGVVLADVLARELGGTMDVVLARKIGAPGNPEYALGAVGEDGQVFLQPYAERIADASYLKAEIGRQMQVIRERRRRYRAVRPKEPLAGRDVVLTDDGIATGSTMEAALTAVLAEQPARVVVAVPVGPPEAVERLRQRAEVVALSTPPDFVAVGAYYRHFPQVSDEDVVRLLSAWAVE
ncbi:phosphoribosyltransferase [Deinococcota bacterium DY0809b]